MIQVDIGGHPPVPNSNWLILTVFSSTLVNSKEYADIQSYDIDFTVVHPLVGYVHKYLALKLFYYGSSKTTTPLSLQLILFRVEIYNEAD
jgi:hypothetical protein